MQHWKFLLYGITGDLSKKKILPALAQFAELNQEKVQIELIGYSRSTPDTRLIQNILDSNTTTGTTVLDNIHYLQGDYADSKVFFDFIGGLKEDERLVTYLAIPPELFLDILKNSCPFSAREIDLIIEKPFGRDLQEAEQMLKVMDACDLHKRIHFSDHYLFKTSTFVSKPEWNNFGEIRTKTLKQIDLKALENLDVKDRGGYYDQTGALKDIFVHLFSLLNLALNSLRPNEEVNYDSFEVLDLSLGQYQSYRHDINTENSQTDTYFQLKSQLTIGDQEIIVNFESGKKLNTKQTTIEAIYDDSSVLDWKIAPENQLEYILPESTKAINLNKNNKLDHTNLFEMLLEGDSSRFVDNRDIVTSWQMYDKIIKFKESHNIQTKLYIDDTYPTKFSS
jgi:glucose-6-phosphate 1-dehydrogenase